MSLTRSRRERGTVPPSGVLHCPGRTVYDDFFEVLGGGSSPLGTDNKNYCFLESKAKSLFAFTVLLSHRQKLIVDLRCLKKTMATAFSPQSMLRLYRNVLRIHKRVLPQV
jgi:hypothetical protein